MGRNMSEATTGKDEEVFTLSFAEVSLAVLRVDGSDVAGQSVLVTLGIETQRAHANPGTLPGSTGERGRGLRIPARTH